MKYSGFYSFLALLLGFLWIIVSTGCETGRAGCEGKIVVENPIPDTTLYVGGDSFHRDIFESPPVFRHTANLAMHISGLNSLEGGIVLPSNKVNPETGKASIIVVKPLKSGKDKVIVWVTDGCPDYEVETRFNVTVLDTTN